MTWAADIDRALVRGGSPYSIGDLFRMLARGTAALFIAGSMTASVALNHRGQPEIFHVAGSWNTADARWLGKKGLVWAKRRGFDTLVANGRPGWRRFMQRKGLK